MKVLADVWLWHSSSLISSLMIVQKITGWYSSSSECVTYSFNQLTTSHVSAGCDSFVLSRIHIFFFFRRPMVNREIHGEMNWHIFLARDVYTHTHTRCRDVHHFSISWEYNESSCVLSRFSYILSLDLYLLHSSETKKDFSSSSCFDTSASSSPFVLLNLMQFSHKRRNSFLWNRCSKYKRWYASDTYPPCQWRLKDTHTHTLVLKRILFHCCLLHVSDNHGRHFRCLSKLSNAFQTIADRLTSTFFSSNTDRRRRNWRERSLIWIYI